MKLFQSNKTVVISFLLLTVVFFSCKKDDGGSSTPTNNYVTYNGTVYDIIYASKATYINTACASNPTIKGSFGLGAVAKGTNDTIYLSFYNVKSYTSTSIFTQPVGTPYCGFYSLLSFSKNRTNILESGNEGNLILDETAKTFNITTGKYLDRQTSTVNTVQAKGTF
jgi:hypothetical protein